MLQRPVSSTLRFLQIFFKEGGWGVTEKGAPMGTEQPRAEDTLAPARRGRGEEESKWRKCTAPSAAGIRPRAEEGGEGGRSHHGGRAYTGADGEGGARGERSPALAPARRWG